MDNKKKLISLRASCWLRICVRHIISISFNFYSWLIVTTSWYFHTCKNSSSIFVTDSCPIHETSSSKEHSLLLLCIFNDFVSLYIWIIKLNSHTMLVLLLYLRYRLYLVVGFYLKHVERCKNKRRIFFKPLLYRET